MTIKDRQPRNSVWAQVQRYGKSNGLSFSDGITINTSGPMRPMQLHDGWYVVGEGMLMAVDNELDAIKYIERNGRDSK